VKVDAPVVALTHVRAIDGSGAAPLEDQTILIEGGRIRAIGNVAKTPTPAGAKVVHLPGYTVIPGLVGMHGHMFYPSYVTPGLYLANNLAFSAPRLYLACGVTTMRTAGSIEPYTDLNLKKLIDKGKMPGPQIYVTSPYLEGPGAFTPHLHELSGPEEARKMVEYWADLGVTSFRAYTNITRAELAAAIDAAHKRGRKITGHLCSVGFREAAAMGIDGLEHGLIADTEFFPGKAPDVCPPRRTTGPLFAQLDMESAPVKEVIHDLVEHHVAIASTLAVWESAIPNRPPLQQRLLDALLPEARFDYLTARVRFADNPTTAPPAVVLKMEFELAFVKTGGLLPAGNDPTGHGGVLPGFGDQREVELLVEADFTPLEAIHIATANGAEWLGETSRIGTLAPGKQANLVVMHRHPSKDISDIEKVEMVFKDGVGYDSAKLIESVRGMVALR